LGSSTWSQPKEPQPQEEKDAAFKKIAARCKEAIQKMDWNAYADLLDPSELEEFRNRLLPALKAAAKAGPEQQKEALLFFPGAADLNAVMAWKPREFFVRSLEAMSKGPLAIYKELYAAEKFEMIGAVREGNDLVHVVYRSHTSFKGLKITSMKVVTLKRNDKEWRAALADEVVGLAEALNQTLKGLGETPKLKD
jgi:hypothetical protein